MRSIVVAGLVVLTSACSSSTSINARCPSPAIADPSVTRYVDQAARQARDWGTLVDLSWMDTDVNADLFIAPTGEVTDICYVSGNERLYRTVEQKTKHWRFTPAANAFVLPLTVKISWDRTIPGRDRWVMPSYQLEVTQGP
jgi:hypothetical protein